MHRSVVALLLAWLTPTGLAGQVRPAGGYVVSQGTTEIAREQYRLEGRTLSSTLTIPSRRLAIHGTTIYDERWSPERYRADAQLEADSAPVQWLDATFGDSVRWEVTGAGAQAGTAPLERPYGVFRNLGFSHLAVELLRYEREAGGPQTVHLWVPDGGVTVAATIDLAGDEGTIALGGVTMRVRLGSDGWLEHLSVPSQRVVAEWRSVEQLTAAPPPAEDRPTPPPGVVEAPFTFTRAGVRLAGTLTLPGERRTGLTVAVIVAGSGPTDRDGNSAAGLRSDMYAQLAWRLAERGVGSLRYDKRGLGGSSRTFDPSQSTIGDYADDVVAAARALAADARVARVVLVGHSEGATLVTLAANTGAPVAGVALLAGVGRPLIEVIREQLAAQLDAETLTRFDTAMARYLAGEDPAGLPSALEGLFLPVNRRFLQTAALVDPLREVARVPVPVLIVQGTTDVQVSVRDADLLAGARPSAELVLIPDANHVFKHATVRGSAAQVAQYTDPSLPLVPALVDAVANWIASLP